MNGLKLVIGSRYASSWSLRPWLLLKQLGLPFEEIVIPLRQPDTAPPHPPPLAFGQGAGPARGRPAHLGLAGDRRISGGAASQPLAGRAGGTGAGACGVLRDAQRLCRPAHLPAHGLHCPLRAAGQAAGVGRGRHRPDRRHLGRVPARRRCRAVPVRPVHHRRRDVRAGLLALRHLCRAADRTGARLCRAHDGPAGDAGMGPRSPMPS